MGKDAKAGGKGKGKQARKSGKAADGLGTCTYVKARHVLCEKQGKINGDKVPPAEFAKQSTWRAHQGGDLGWFPRGKMAGPFQDVAVNTPVGVTSASFKSTRRYHIIFPEGRKN
ncbi:hypothetical protein Bca52824_072609 [Brassica carinata]|uniref:Peptidyl-prolyl cis-trans isomerase n=1 Tax=Brassica carinata TaxID=52824 RepID=A0A8X7U436_BRACI|nr:hypothetical protein Bca52824_072609 [Brassica carinata]